MRRPLRWRRVQVIATTATAALLCGLLQVGWATPLGHSGRPRPEAAPHTAPAATAAAGDAGAVRTAGAGGAGGQEAGTAVARLVADRPADAISIAATDTVTGARYRYGAASGMPMGSVAKLLFLEGYLLRNQDRGQAPGDGAADALAAMIEHSDNDAADAVYAALGGRAGVSAVIGRLGLTATMLPPSDHWGLGTTSATDQLILLHDLTVPHGPLSPASQAYALQLMSQVETDQRWGVAAAADPGTMTALKNGWLGVDADGGRWLVNSVGVISLHGRAVLLAVLTQHNDDFSGGVALVQSLARATVDMLAPPVTPAPARPR